MWRGGKRSIVGAARRRAPGRSGRSTLLLIATAVGLVSITAVTAAGPAAARQDVGYWELTDTKAGGGAPATGYVPSLGPSGGTVQYDIPAKPATSTDAGQLVASIGFVGELPTRVEASRSLEISADVAITAADYNGDLSFTFQSIAYLGDEYLGLGGEHRIGCTWGQGCTLYEPNSYDLSFTLGEGAADGDTRVLTWIVLNCGAACDVAWTYTWRAAAPVLEQPSEPVSDEAAEPDPPAPEPEREPPEETTTTVGERNELDNCGVNGRVTDIDDNPVPDVDVELYFSGNLSEQTITDADGRYRFAEVGSVISRDLEFDAELDPIAVRFELTASDRSYAVHHGDTNELAVLRVGDVYLSELPAGCTVDLGPDTTPEYSESVGGTRKLGDWGRLLRTFRNIGRAKQYSEEALGVTWDQPDTLVVIPYCAVSNLGPCGGEAQAAWDGPQYGRPSEVPTIFFKTRLVNNYDDGPTNVEYHEVGHHVMMEGFSNNMPFQPPGSGEHKNHGGLYRNNTSNDALVEGFAEFFASQVRRDIDGVDGWWIYPVDDTKKSLERNYEIWEPYWEELAFAGILVDLVDGSGTYDGVPVTEIEGGNIVACSPPDCAEESVILAFENNSPRPVSYVIAQLEYEQGQRGFGLFRVGEGTDVSTTIPPGEVALAVVPLADGLSAADIVSATAGTANKDDDPIEVTAREVWDALRITPFPTDPSYPHPETVARVYESLSFAFGGDRDNDGVDDIDKIFIEHGYYADTAGGVSNRSYDPGEQIGASGYYDRPFLGERFTHPDREAPLTPPIETARFNVRGALGPAAFVEVLFPSEPGLSYAYVSRLDDNDDIGVSLPGADTGAIVRVTAIADGWQPFVVGEIDVREFWTEHSAELDESVLVFDGDFSTRPVGFDDLGGDDGGLGIPMWAIAGGIGGFVAMGARSLRRRRADG